MIRPPARSTRLDTPFPSTALFRSDEFIARGRVTHQSQPRTRRALRAAPFAKRGERVAYLQIDAVDDTACGGFEKAKTNLRNVLPIAAVVRRDGAFENGQCVDVAQAQLWFHALNARIHQTQVREARDRKRVVQGKRC